MSLLANRNILEPVGEKKSGKEGGDSSGGRTGSTTKTPPGESKLSSGGLSAISYIFITLIIIAIAGVIVFGVYIKYKQGSVKF